MTSRFITPGAAILCAVCLAISGWALAARFRDTNSLRRDNARAWHLSVCYLETLTLNNKHATDKQKADAIIAYDHILELVHAAPCR